MCGGTQETGETLACDCDVPAYRLCQPRWSAAALISASEKVSGMSVTRAWRGLPRSAVRHSTDPRRRITGLCTERPPSSRSTDMGLGGTVAWPVTSARRRSAPSGRSVPVSGRGGRGRGWAEMTGPASRAPELDAPLRCVRGWPAAAQAEAAPGMTEGGEPAAACSGAAARGGGMTGARLVGSSTTEPSPGFRCCARQGGERGPRRERVGSRYTSGCGRRDGGLAPPSRRTGRLAVTWQTAWCARAG